MFKNLTVYRIGPDWTADAGAIASALDKQRFVPCGATQQESIGWVEPRGEAHAPLVEVVDGQIILKLKSEKRLLPGSVVKERVEEIAEQIEEQTGRKPGKKQTKELKEQALLELLPMAFTKRSALMVWIAPRERLLVVDAGGQGRADEVVGLLVKALDGLAVSHLQTELSPASAMTGWLGTGEPPYGFTVDRECELKSPDEMKSVVRYARHPLDTDEVKQHITQGKVPTRLAMTWLDRVSFVLTESLQVKKLAFLDVVLEARDAGGKPSKDEAFDADAALATGELRRMIPELVEALGGELMQLPGGPRAADGPAVPVAAVPAAVGVEAGASSSESDAPPW